MSRPADPRVVLGALACLAQAGCSIPLHDMESPPVNSCSSSSDCADGSVCASTADGQTCVSSHVDLPGLLIEIRPPGNSPFGANVSYLLDIAEQGYLLQGENPSGQVHTFDPDLPALATINGKLSFQSGALYCEQDPQTALPVSVTFKRVSQFLGLEAFEYTTEATLVNEGEAVLHGFEFQIPEGDYHVYIAPKSSEACKSPSPPVFLPKQTIVSQTNLKVNASEPYHLTGILTLPEENVDGWSLEVVDSIGGNVISDVQTLEQGSPSTVDLDFDWTDFDADNIAGFTPVIRLRPPEDSGRPNVHWDLSAVALQGSADDKVIEVDLSLTELNAAPRQVGGKVLDGAKQPVIATITIRSASLPGGVNASYELKTETNEEGVFSAALPPGKYIVYARPFDPTKAAAEHVLEFSEGNECYCGQTIVVLEASKLRGQVHGPAGEQMTSSFVGVSPSLSAARDYLNEVLEVPPLLPRPVYERLEGSKFEFDVDPGVIDFSIQSSGGSRYPWFVRSRVQVQSADTSPLTDLGSITIPYPAILQGIIRAPEPSGVVLPGTTVRALLPVRDPTAADELVGVIQIGEVEAGPDGSYVLPLPPSLSQ